MPTSDAELRALEEELEGYARFRRRMGDDGFRLTEAVACHREQCMVNLLADEDEIWAERVRLLDALAERRNIPMPGARPLRYALDEISERERQRRAERVQLERRRRGQQPPLRTLAGAGGDEAEVLDATHEPDRTFPRDEEVQAIAQRQVAALRERYGEEIERQRAARRAQEETDGQESEETVG